MNFEGRSRTGSWRWCASSPARVTVEERPNGLAVDGLGGRARAVESFASL
jgi:hypothetical protein